jgi:UDP-glucuronate decarboxylase
VDDLVEALVRLMNADGIHEPVNLGDPHEFTIAELAREIVGLCGGSNEILHRALPEDDPAQRCPDIARARLLLSWAPQVELRDGLQRTIADFKTRLAGTARVKAGGRAAQRHASAESQAKPSSRLKARGR